MRFTQISFLVILLGGLLSACGGNSSANSGGTAQGKSGPGTPPGTPPGPTRNPMTRSKVTVEGLLGGDKLGTSISLSGNTAAVYAFSYGNNAYGAVHIFNKTQAGWQWETAIETQDFPTVLDSQLNPQIALSGDTLAIRTPGDMNLEGQRLGAILIFRREAQGWHYEARISNPESQNTFNFGYSLALDQDTLVVTSISNINRPVYVFERADSVWTLSARLTGSSISFEELFGESLAVSNDIVVVGAPGNDEGPLAAVNSGAAYVFSRESSGWAQTAILRSRFARSGANFGTTVATSGTTIAIGAPSETSSARGVNGDETNQSASSSGAVYTFVQSNDAWVQESYIKASNTGAQDKFGSAISIAGDRLIVGASLEDGENEAISNSGAAYYFERNQGQWSELEYLKANNPAATDQFGYSVAVSSSALLVGMPNADDSFLGMSNLGALFSFEL